MTNQKEIAKKQAEIVGQLQQFPIGRTNSGGRAGGMVEVVVTNPLPGQPRVVQGKCANDCAPGDVQLLKVDDGSYVALSPTAAVKTSETTTRQVSKKESVKPKKKEVKDNIKILFYVNSEISPFPGSPSTVERLWKELWIGGTWPVKKIYTVPEGYRLVDAFIVNTGEKEEDYTIIGRLFPVYKVHVNWFNQPNTINVPTLLETPAAILFTIEKGVTEELEFNQNSCYPYFWRYCGGGFFYSSGSEIGVNAIGNGSQYLNEYWPKAYNWYNGWVYNYTFGTYTPRGNDSSFINFALTRTGMLDIQTFGNYVVTPENDYTPIISDRTKRELLVWHPVDGVYQPPAMLFGVDISSKWYFKTKTIQAQQINTFYSYLVPGVTLEDPTPPGPLGFMGEFCVTPTKDFAVNYQASTDGSDEYAALYATGFLYEPLIVNKDGTKTLVIKQVSRKAYNQRQTNSLLVLSEKGESSTFTEITGIPELNNFNALGLQFALNTTTIYPYIPLFFGGYSSILDATYFDPTAPVWNEALVGTLQVYYNTSGTNYSLSINQSESNKEILYLKDFLLNFAKFTGLTTIPSNDVRTSYSTLSDQCNFLKPLSSYIANNVYIPYGFIDTNNTFYGTQSLKYAEPEKTRLLPETNKATVKIVELELNEVTAQVKVADTIKSLQIYMVTPGNTGSPTIALASANYWCKAKTKGEPRPVFTPTAGEEPITTPTPTPSPSPSPEPTPTPTPTPGYGYGY